MKKDILSSIEQVEIYPIISLLIFVIFFLGVFIWVFRTDKKYIDHMREMPLHDKNQNIEGDEKF